ncbi:helix-turn-helix transcriptional regulator [Paenibacillus sp. alder61]|uniref:Helix-turn-helix transcriptional regulator n=1 Tax=Paenibacillus faecis TaxID=862114 RepID=A0A5D0CPU5_9BACL|nr:MULTISPECIES: helix-turn-helix transcriptional regulator [Paenibacillus]MCA1294976.1 helix-turn-helix transcriptional regulator [Paenibacillus sp. alder61]TYA10757.1 helix-turn-helix transcriptional regulator [Paenibacillus faecis]
MPIRLRLKEILEERGMSQRELARRMNIRPSTISHLCSDKVNAAYFDTLEQICKTLNIGLHELLIMEEVEED